MKEVSIVVPVYNSNDVLDICLKSILAQTFRDFELLLIDDGSTDESLKICRKWEKEDNRVSVYTKNNGGPSSARNFGIQKAAGKYLMFVDSDDYISPGYIEKMIAVKREYGENVQPVSVFLRFTEEPQWQQEEITNKRVLQGNEFLKVFQANLLHSNVNKLYNNTIIQQQSLLFSEKYSIGEDLLFNIAYLKNSNIHKFIILENNYYFYRRSNLSSLSHRFHENYYESHEKQFEELFELAIQKKVSEDDYEILKKRHDLYLEHILKYNMCKDNPQSFKEKVKKNSTIMQTTQFRKYIEKKKGEFPPFQERAYRSGSYFYVWLTEIVLKLYRKIKGID